MKRSSQSRPASFAPRTLRTALLAAGSASLFLVPWAGAQVWDAQAAPDLNWSTPANWDTDASPADGAAVSFSTVGTAAVGTITNVVNPGLSIGTLSFTQTGGAVAAHTTQIAAGQTLTVSGTGVVSVFGRVADATVNDSTTVFTGSGSLAVTGGATANINVGLPTGPTFTSGNAVGTHIVDMSGLSSFTADMGTFNIGYTAQGFYSQAGIVKLPPAASIIATTVAVGATTSLGVTAPTTSLLELGQTATLNANTITIGAGKSTGALNFRAGLTGATATIADRAGTGPANLNIGTHGISSVANPVGTVDFTGGAVTANLGVVTLGGTRSNTGTAASGTGHFILGPGSITATTLNVGNANGNVGNATGNVTLAASAGTLTAGTVIVGKGAATGNGAATGTITQNGGTAAITTLSIGDKPGSGTGAVAGTYNLADGVLKASAIQAGASSPGTITRAFNWTGGTLRNLDGADLIVSGVPLTVTGAGAHTFLAETGRTITINSGLVGTGGFSKTGAGTLVLTAANTHAGDITVDDGTLTLADNATLKFTIGASGTNNQVGGLGAFTINGDFDFDLLAAGTTLGNSWQIVDTAALSETYGPTFSVTGFAASTGKWVKPANGTFYEFDPATGLLRVISDPGISYPPPTVTLGQHNTTYPIGANLVLNVGASGTGNLTYQWYYQANSGATPVEITGATSASYTVSNATGSATGLYSVVVTDHAAEASGKPPTTATALFPLISVVPVSDLVVAYHRFEEGVVGETAGGANDSSPSGANPLSSGLNSPAFSDDVPLVAVPSTTASNARSLAFGLGDTRSLVASTGGALASTGFKNFTIEAFVKFTTVSGVSTIVGRDDSSPEQAAGQNALFYLQRNGGGFRVQLVDRSGAVLFATGTGVVTNRWYHVAAVGDGIAGTLTLYVNGQAVGSATGFTGLLVPAGGSDTPWTVGRGDFNLEDTDPMRGWIDEVRFTDAALSSQGFLNNKGGVAILPPVVSVSPAGRAVRPGGSASFTVTATSQMGGTLSYQWYKDGVAMSGQTGATLALGGVTVAADGAYHAVVTDSASGTSGTPVSSTVAAQLQVIDIPWTSRAIGLNFVGTSSGNANYSTALGSADTAPAGFVPTAGWNDSATVSGVSTQSSPLTLKESDGSEAAGVTATWSSSGTWSARTGTGDPSVKTPDARLLHGYIESRNPGTTVALSNIPYANYDVYVYVVGGTNGNVGSISIDRDSPFFYYRVLQHDSYVPAAVPSAENPYSVPPMVGESESPDAARTAPAATFVRFANVSGPSLSIAVTDAVTNANAGGIAAVHIVDRSSTLAAPAGLGATPGAGQVALNWNASAGASSYTVFRSTHPTFGYAAVAGGLTSTTYTDTTVTGGVTYYYVVSASAISPATESGYSTEVSATPTAGGSPLQSWRQTHFGTTANSGDAANTADPDADGQVNLLEYALGTNPNTAGALPVTVARSGAFLTLSFPRIADSNLVYMIEASDTLSGWSVVHTYSAFETTGTTTYTDMVPLTSQSRRFLRLVVTAP